MEGFFFLQSNGQQILCVMYREQLKRSDSLVNKNSSPGIPAEGLELSL